MSDRVIYNSPNRITQHYGNGHKGVDLGWSNIEEYNKVFANCIGTVYSTLDNIPHGSEQGGGWGNYVYIRHPNGMFSRYAHLKSGLPVKAGDIVNEETCIGIMGNSGRSTGRHLHFEVSTGVSTSSRINPEPYLTKFIYEDNSIKYRVHLEGLGWTDWKSNGATAGTTSEGRRLEAIEIDNKEDVEAKAHIENYGWVNYGRIDKNTIIGTEGKGLRLECLCLKGNFEYRVHIEGSGWSCWTNADGICTLGSVGQGLRIEAIEMRNK